MRTGFLVYRPDGAIEPYEVDWPVDPSLEQIEQIVLPFLGGAPMEHVTVLDPEKVDADEVDRRVDRRDMFIEEWPEEPRARNENATRIYRANWLRAHPDTDPESLSAIYGTAVLFDRIIWR